MNDPISIAGIDDFACEMKRVLEQNENLLSFVKSIVESGNTITDTHIRWQAERLLKEIGERSE